MQVRQRRHVTFRLASTPVVDTPSKSDIQYYLILLCLRRRRAVQPRGVAVVRFRVLASCPQEPGHRASQLQEVLVLRCGVVRLEARV